jgi:MFS transporter, PPP family, 3-phenylpropionic acid transporter
MKDSTPGLISQANRLRILYFLVFTCTASWLPVMADFASSRGLSGKQIALVLSITPLMMLIIQPVYGYLADRWGHRRSLILAAWLGSFSFLGYLWGGGLLSILITTILMSVFYNTIQPLMDSMALEYCREDPRFSYGSLRIAGALGWSTTGILIGQIIDRLSIDKIFLISSFSLILFALVAHTIPIATNKMPTPDDTPGLVSIKKIRWNRPIIFFLCIVSLVAIASTAIWNFYSLYMKENGASATLVGFGLSFQGLCEIPFFYLSARILKKWGFRTSFLVAISATAVRLFLYYWIRDPRFAIPIELLQGLSWSFFWVICVEYISILFDARFQATGQSLLYSAYFGLGAILGNYWTGSLIDLGWKIGDMFLLNAVLVGAILMLVAWNRIIFTK